MSSSEISTGCNLFKCPQLKVCKTGRTRLPLKVGRAVLTYHSRCWSEAVITGERVCQVLRQLVQSRSSSSGGLRRLELEIAAETHSWLGKDGPALKGLWLWTNRKLRRGWESATWKCEVRPSPDCPSWDGPRRPWLWTIIQGLGKRSSSRAGRAIILGPHIFPAPSWLA